MGTPEYMAPEQAAGKPVDARVDIYSVGAILYEMLVAEPPHAGANVMDILAKKATQPAAPIRPRNKSVPEPLERVILACLDKEPANRPQTMATLEYELTKCMKGRGTAVAAVLGIKAPDEGATWNDAAAGFDQGFATPAQVTTPRAASATSGRIATNSNLPSVGGLAELLEPATGLTPAEGQEALVLPTPSLNEASPASQTLEPMPVAGSAWSRVLGILGGLAFLAAGGYFAYTYQLRHMRPDVPSSSQKTTPPAAKQDPTPPPDPTAPTPPKRDPSAPPNDERLSQAEIDRLLEWARVAAKGGRIVTPPGDNLKDLLDRIDKASPGNREATALRSRTASLLGRRGTLALKKQRLEEAEDAFRALVILKPDDEWSRGRLARTLAVRADRSLERRRYAAAINDANQALEILPDDVMARMALAEAYLATGKRELAAEEFKRILELRPADKRAKAGLQASLSAPPKRPIKKKR
jgi:tetratricopeptide (TPR) repeat protein